MNALQKSLYHLDGAYYLSSKAKEDNNMPMALNYQFSIFGNYSIVPTPEIVTQLMARINASTGEAFLPNIINAQQIEVSSNQIKSISNLGFITQNHKYSISLLNNRIDINYNKNNDEAAPEIDQFFYLATKGLNEIINYFNLSSYRLAANFQLVFELPNFERLQILGNKVITTASYYDGKTFCEWSNRVNSQAEINILGATEGINVITDISSATSVQGEPAILYHIDINTLPQNQRMRFSSPAIEAFSEAVIPTAKEIIADVERLIGNEQ